MKAIKIFLQVSLVTVFVIGCKSSPDPTLPVDDTSDNKELLSLLTDYRTTQYFTNDNVPLEDITAILEAGRNAPSGLNKQLWFFSAILNQDVIKEIAGTFPERKPRPSNNSGDGEKKTEPTVPVRKKAQFADAPSAIILACDESQKFALGLASEAMLVAAESLGYGTKTMAGVARHFNTPEILEMLKIPEGQAVVAVLVIGKVDTSIDYSMDGVTGPSTRKDLEEVSTIIQ